MRRYQSTGVACHSAFAGPEHLSMTLHTHSRVSLFGRKVLVLQP